MQMWQFVSPAVKSNTLTSATVCQYTCSPADAFVASHADILRCLWCSIFPDHWPSSVTQQVCSSSGAQLWDTLYNQAVVSGSHTAFISSMSHLCNGSQQVIQPSYNVWQQGYLESVGAVPMPCSFAVAQAIRK